MQHSFEELKTTSYIIESQHSKTFRCFIDCEKQTVSNEMLQTWQPPTQLFATHFPNAARTSNPGKRAWFFVTLTNDKRWGSRLSGSYTWDWRGCRSAVGALSGRMVKSYCMRQVLHWKTEPIINQSYCLPTSRQTGEWFLEIPLASIGRHGQHTLVAALTSSFSWFRSVLHLSHL